MSWRSTKGCTTKTTAVYLLIEDRMNPSIETAEKHLEGIALLLNALVADEYVLYTKTRNAHWNIQGQNYCELHEFFESQYEALDIIIDDVEERVRALGRYALGSLKDFTTMTQLSEHNHDFTEHKSIMQTLLVDHEAVIRSLRKDISAVFEEYRDFGTADFMTGLMEQHEKMSWMLRAELSSCDTHEYIHSRA